MPRFLFHLLFVGATTFAFLGWARRQIEAQIDKMQQEAFDTPGVDAPIPLVGLLAGLGLLASQLALGRLLRLTRWQSMLDMLMGVGAAVAMLSALRNRR